MFDAIQAIPTTRPHTPLLDTVDNVADLRAVPEHKLPQLAHEIRHYLLYCVGQTGGHLGAGLGVVELTIALHYLLHTPDDKIIWDVGHQTYPHKILTGRKQQMLTMRQMHGLSAFPKRTESEFDSFGVGHASTSISALLGMVLMEQQQNQHACHHVAVIGDGALTGGMAYEALNHMAHTQANALIVLNDNDMSISVNQGGLATFLDDSNKTAGPKAWFNALGFYYVGPIDGHNLPDLLVHVRLLLALPGPKLLHLHTTKGKGYEPAEADPMAYHAIDKIEPVSSQQISGMAKTQSGAQKYKAQNNQGKSFAVLFGQWACQLAANDRQLQIITPAMVGGSGLTHFAREYPLQLHDVAIAEQHAVTLAAGMACAGGKPVVAIYSTFLQRGYDQLVHDIALQNLDVLFAIDRAGVVGEDGATHTGAYDYGYLTCLPNMVVLSPSNAFEMQAMLSFGYQHSGPVAVRYPRAIASQVKHNQLPSVCLGEANMICQGTHVALLNFGPLLDTAKSVADELGTTLVDMRFVKPLDTHMLAELLDHDYWVTIEDHAVVGGAGALVAQWLASYRLADDDLIGGHDRKNKPALLNLGLLDQVQPHGTRTEILSANGLDSDSIMHAVMQFAAV